MSLRQLKWATIAVAILFLICIQGIAMGLVMPAWGRPAGHIVSITGFSAGILLFTAILYRKIEQMQAEIVRQNEELAATNAVSRAVAGSLDIGVAMERALENVMRVTGAAAGEIVVNGEHGEEPRRFALGSKRHSEALHGCPAADRPVAGNDGLLVVPLCGQGREIGAVRLLRDRSQPLRATSDSLLAGIGAQVAMSVMAGQLHEDVIRRQRTAQALYGIAVDITALENAQEVLWPIADRTREMLGAETVAISLLDPAGAGVTLAAWSGEVQEPHSPHEAGSWFPLAEVEMHSRDGHGCGCPIVGSDARRYSAPMCAASDRIGELSIAVPQSRTLSEEDLELLSALADLAAIAVQKSRLLERERRVAVLEERERLAREMHDSLAQVLGYLNLRSETALRKLHANDLANTEVELLEMSAIAKEAYADVREAILGLREGVSSSRSFVDALREYVQKFSRQASVNVRLDIDGGDSMGLSPEGEVQLLRVIQEALTNVRKHANAAQARVSIGRNGGEAAIVVEDDGRGFDTTFLQESDAATFGLRTMQERVERVGGRFTVESVPEKGTSVRIFLPVNGGHNGS